MYPSNLVTRVENQKRGSQNGQGPSWTVPPELEDFNKHLEEMNLKGYKLLQTIYVSEGYTLFWEKV